MVQLSFVTAPALFYSPSLLSAWCSLTRSSAPLYYQAVWLMMLFINCRHSTSCCISTVWQSSPSPSREGNPSQPCTSTCVTRVESWEPCRILSRPCAWAVPAGVGALHQLPQCCSGTASGGLQVPGFSLLISWLTALSGITSYFDLFARWVKKGKCFS